MTDTDNKKNSPIVVLNRIPPDQELIKANRTLLAVIFSLMAIIVAVGFVLFPSGRFINDYQKIAATQTNNSETNPELSAEVNSLKVQVVGIVSSSIESKLRTLEENIRLGAVSDSLGAIEDLKNDVKVLQSYTSPEKKEKVAIANEQLMQEMTELKNLIYIGIASCGLMLAAAAGVWIRNSKQLSYKDFITRYLDKN